MRTWKIGEELCDMHYGLPSKSYYPCRTPVETRSHIRFSVKDSDWVAPLLQSAGVGNDWYINKMAIVIGESKTDWDGWMVAVYCYDGMTAGMFEFREKQEVPVEVSHVHYASTEERDADA